MKNKITLNYISGFFDADGSITLSNNSNSSKYKYLKIDFTNTEKELLEEIQQLLLEYDIKTYISTKPARKINHSISYVLSASNNYAIKLCQLLNSRHPKKLHRINCINKYYNIVTIRNGKYNTNQISKKLAFERLFFWSSFS